MELIEGIALSNLCDYSFGDQSGQWGNIYTSFMKHPNLNNTEFVSKLFEVKKSFDYMTLFIDNIRLYKRDIIECKEEDFPYIQSLWENGDLLSLCAKFPAMKFIIFTNLEDTPIDDYIFDSIPDNVLKICAVNAVANGGKVIPAPYGVQRKIHPHDNRVDCLKMIMNNVQEKFAKKLLYVSHNENSHSERFGTREMFINKEWTTVDTHRVNYDEFLLNLREHKFMLCPRGNAIDCHRNWEVLYMRRVPIMKKHSYLQELFKDYPVLFVDDFAEVTEELLTDNDYLFQEAQGIDLSILDLNNFYNTTVKNAL